VNPSVEFCNAKLPKQLPHCGNCSLSVLQCFLLLLLCGKSLKHAVRYYHMTLLRTTAPRTPDPHSFNPFFEKVVEKIKKNTRKTRRVLDTFFQIGYDAYTNG
jgi:hypothetical protein